jgi:hypothetical protein
MAEPKTKPTAESVTEFLNEIEDEGKRRDAFAVAAMMGEITKEKPRMWGTSIVGYGTWRYTYASGQEGDWPVAAFSPRKQNLTLYLTPGFEQRSELMSKLGKHKTGKSCLYLNRLEDVHLPTLKTLIRQSVKDVQTLRKKAK